MEIRRWITVNIMFNENERKRAAKLILHYEKRGYDSNGESEAGDDSHEICTQLVSQTSSKETEGQ